MNREETIAIIRKEYLCVDRDCDIERNCGKCDLMMPSKEPILEAYKIAIKALEQEPCKDAISRQAVLDILKREGRKWGNDYRDWVDAIEEIKNLSSVNPTKTGWIPVSERLPENRKEVLVTDGTDIFTGWYEGDKWCSCYEEFYLYSDPIIAWMPLPKPYEPQERSDKE